MMNDTPPVVRYRPYNSNYWQAKFAQKITPKQKKKNDILRLMKPFCLATHSGGTSGLQYRNKSIDTCNTFKLRIWSIHHSGALITNIGKHRIFNDARTKPKKNKGNNNESLCSPYFRGHKSELDISCSMMFNDDID
jgi:hypothetical protein